jgi:lysine 6-dehydrogenase
MSDFLILGAGKMGAVVARNLIESGPEHSVTIADRSPDQLAQAALSVCDERLTTLTLEVAEGLPSEAALRDRDVVVGALPHRYSLPALAAAVRSGVHFVDLVGEWPDRRLECNAEAQARGITVLSGMGVAPGISNVCVGRAVESLDETDSAAIYVGGIPRNPRPPLNYRVVFAIESVLEAYEREASIIEDGRLQVVPPLSGVEPIAFPAPFEALECFYTDGLGSLLHTMRGRITRELVEKTVRYPGHVQVIEVLKACGLFSREAVEVAGRDVVPRRVLERVLDAKLRLGDEQDVTLLRVVVSGRKGNEPATHVFEMVDHYDPTTSLTSMARTTGFPASIAAQMIADGTIDERGVLFPEDLFSGELFEPLMDALAQSGIVVTHEVRRG